MPSHGVHPGRVDDRGAEPRRGSQTADVHVVGLSRCIMCPRERIGGLELLAADERLREMADP